MAQQQRPARSVGARGGHEGPVSTPGPHPTSESAPTVPERAPPLRTPTSRSPSAQARAPTTIRPAVAGRLTAPRVVASSPFRCRSRARLRAPQTSAHGRSLRLVSYFFRRRPEPNRVQIPSGVRERRQGNPVVARRRASDASAPRSCPPGRGLRIVRCRASRALLLACSLAAAARSSVLPASDRLRACVVGRRPLSVDSASRVGSFVRASRRHVDLPGVHTFRPDRAFRWCAHLPVPGVHAVPAFPQGKINNLATLLGGRSAILVFLSWGPRGDPKRGVHTFLAHRPFGWGPGTFALANWSPENALASWCAHSASRCARAHQIGVRSWDELPRFCSSGRGCRGRESDLGTQLGSPRPSECAHSGVYGVHTRFWPFSALWRGLSPSSGYPPCRTLRGCRIRGISRWQSVTTPGAWSSIRRTSSPRSSRSFRAASGSAARCSCAVLSGKGWLPRSPI